MIYIEENKNRRKSSIIFKQNVASKVVAAKEIKKSSTISWHKKSMYDSEQLKTVIILNSIRAQIKPKGTQIRVAC
jgi:hypothetical protein